MKNIILGFLLLAQLTVWFVIDPPWSDKKARTDIVDEKKLEAVAIDQIGRIIIHPPGTETMTLEKVEDMNPATTVVTPWKHDELAYGSKVSCGS